VSGPASRSPEAPNDERRPKIVITGTGRTGTTLLVQILTELGLDTGFAPGVTAENDVHAGLEKPLTGPDAPRIVKSPELSRRLAGMLERQEVVLEHVIVPVRDLDIAAASRVRNTRYGANLHTFGGLFGTNRASRQSEALALVQYELMLTLARFDVPYTLLLFPRFATDWHYTYDKLSFLDGSLPPERWEQAVAATVRPELIHEQPLSQGERVLTGLGTAYNRVVVRPARGVRKLLRGDGPESGGSSRR
jgi:hypothetical protein